MVLRRTSDIKMLLCCVRRLCSIIIDHSVTSKRKKSIIGSSSGNKAEVKSMSYSVKSNLKGVMPCLVKHDLDAACQQDSTQLVTYSLDCNGP